MGAIEGQGPRLLEAKGIVKDFGGLPAVRDVDIEVASGEIVGVIGPNGAGKTTLVNCLCGLERPSSGRTIFQGADVTGAPAHVMGRLGVARTFQVVRPLRQLTVLDNVAVGAMFGAGGSRRSTVDARARAREVLRLVGLDHRTSQRAQELTLPDLKRLELARALAMDPKLLFLDEVMAGLNPSEINRATDLILRISGMGIALLVIEHVMKAIMTLSHRLVVLHQGRKIADGDPRDVTARPEVLEVYLGKRFARSQEGHGSP